MCVCVCIYHYFSGVDRLIKLLAPVYSSTIVLANVEASTHKPGNEPLRMSLSVATVGSRKQDHYAQLSPKLRLLQSSSLPNGGIPCIISTLNSLVIVSLSL